jgi:class 3 adenylate cyclase
VFTALGDVVNVSARLRDLNRELGTRIIASEDVVKDLDTKLLLHPLVGQFILKGVTHVPVIFEVAGPVKSVPQDDEHGGLERIRRLGV